MQLIISRLQYFSSLEKRVLFFTFRYFWRLDTFVLDISIPFCVFGYFWHLDTLFWHFDTWFLTFGSFDIWIRFFWHFDTFGPYRNVLVSRCNCIEMSMYRNVSLPYWKLVTSGFQVVNFSDNSWIWTIKKIWKFCSSTTVVQCSKDCA